MKFVSILYLFVEHSQFLFRGLGDWQKDHHLGSVYLCTALWKWSAPLGYNGVYSQSPPLLSEPERSVRLCVKSTCQTQQRCHSRSSGAPRPEVRSSTDAFTATTTPDTLYLVLIGLGFFFIVVIIIIICFHLKLPEWSIEVRLFVSIDSVARRNDDQQTCGRIYHDR